MRQVAGGNIASGYPYKDNICWSWPMRQVAGGNTLSGYPYKDNIYWSWPTCQVEGRNTPSCYPYKDNMCSSWPMRQVAGGYTQVIIRTKTTSIDPDPCVRWQADISNWLSVQRQHLLILTHATSGRQIYPCDYLYQDNICWSWPMRQVAGRYTRVIIHTKTTSVDPNPCVRWHADIPMWLSKPRQHLLILSQASGGRQIYPSDYPYKDNICWSWPKGQVAGGHSERLSVQRQHLLILTHASDGK